MRVLCSEAAISKLSIFARDLTIRFDCIRTKIGVAKETVVAGQRVSFVGYNGVSDIVVG